MPVTWSWLILDSPILFDRWWSSYRSRGRLHIDDSSVYNIYILNIHWTEVYYLSSSKFFWVLFFPFRHITSKKLHVAILSKRLSSLFKSRRPWLKIVKFMIGNCRHYPRKSSHNIVTSVCVYLNLPVPYHSANIFIFFIIPKRLTTDALL